MSGRIAACLAFRNAARYLREWLLFHTASGIDTFFLYNNDSTDDFRPEVAPWVSAGRAEIIDWPGEYQQQQIYDDCLARGRGRCTWIAFIDDDEFLFDPAGRPLAEVLRHFDDVAGVAVSWFLYGTSGRIYPDPEYVIERFTRRREYIDQHHKCIVRPERIRRSLISGHLFEPLEGFPLVDQARQPVTTPITDRPVGGPLRINHYLTKSVMELIERRTSRDIGTGNRLKRPLLDWLGDDRTWNAVEDTSAQVLLGRMGELAKQFPTQR